MYRRNCGGSRLLRSCLGWVCLSIDRRGGGFVQILRVEELFRWLLVRQRILLNQRRCCQCILPPSGPSLSILYLWQVLYFAPLFRHSRSDLFSRNFPFLLKTGIAGNGSQYVPLPSPFRRLPRKLSPLLRHSR